jgi:fatty acid desaturase
MVLLPKKEKNTLENRDFFHDIDYGGFERELNELHQELQAGFGLEDEKHLKKIERWGRICTFLGYATSWFAFHPFSFLLISQGNFTRWTMMSHHISHRGYDRLPQSSPAYRSSTFAKGKRRFLDWPDWIIPAAWNLEHNTFHHYYTSELSDPDLVEENVYLTRELKAPLGIRIFIIAIYMCLWKILYYAPNTLWLLRRIRERKKNPGDRGPLHQEIDTSQVLTYHGIALLLPFSRGGLEFWWRCVLPYSFFRFLLIPLCFLPLGEVAFFCVLFNSLAAEIVTNIHSFLVIIPNHGGRDLYRFDRPLTDRAEFYVRQVLSSTNYQTGSDFRDFMQGWLNYQIEHHLWPDLSMLQYQKAQTRVKAICEKYKVPYIQEPLYRRVLKVLRIMLAWDTMKFAETLSKKERSLSAAPALRSVS